MSSAGASEMVLQVARDLAAVDGGPRAPLGIVAGSRRCASGAAEQIHHWARAQGAHVFTGSWHRSLRRPFGGLAELAGRLAEWMRTGDSDLLGRFGIPLVNLLPAWRLQDGLRATRELRSRLASFTFQGDRGGLREFYWRRDVSPWMAAELGRLFSETATALTAATGRPLVLLLDGVPAADETAHQALEIIGQHTSRTPALLCAVFAGPSRNGAPGAGWKMIAAENEAEAELPSPARLSAPAGRLLAAAAVLALPSSVEDWRSLAEEAFSAPATADLEELVQQGWIESPREDALAVTMDSRRNALLAGLDPSFRRRLHRLAFDREQADPFVALWHAEYAGSAPEGVDLAALRSDAVKRAWGVSDYRCAVVLARRARLWQRQPAPERDLVLALLAYERGRFREAERRLEGARLRTADGTGLDEPTRQLLLGYNAVFGIGELDRGRLILADACRLYEERGRIHEANSVRNSMAFALARSGRLEDALHLEETAFATLGHQGPQDAFLAIILQLNLARLQRNAGKPELAVDLLQRALDDSRQELSPYLLLILHTALAEIHAARGDDAAALAAVGQGYELARDLKLDPVSDPVIGALSRILGRRLEARLSRSDEVLVSFELVLAALCGRLGLTDQARAWQRNARAHGSGMVEVLTPGDNEPVSTASRWESSLATAGLSASEELFPGLLEQEESRTSPASAAERLAAGNLLVLVLGVDGGPGWPLGLVLFDPRRRDLAARAGAEMGAERWSGAPAAIAVEAAADLFQPRLDPSLPGYQEATLRHGERQRLTGLTPILPRVQVVSSLSYGFLGDLVARFAERTGVGLLGALPFHLRNRDLANDPRRAVAAFLVSSVDDLLLGDRLFVKRYGREAIENLLPFRPLLSRNAEILPHGGSGGLVVRVWIWSQCSHLGLNEAMRPFLSDCDGRRTLDELLPEWKRRLGDHPQADRQIHAFLRDLWHRGVIRFDPPAADGASQPFPSWSMPQREPVATESRWVP